MVSPEASPKRSPVWPPGPPNPCPLSPPGLSRREALRLGPEPVEATRLTAAWELKDNGFRGTAGGDFPATGFSPTGDCTLSLAAPEVPRRGGGNGFLSARASGPFRVILELGTQSGSSSLEKGLDLR